MASTSQVIGVPTERVVPRSRRRALLTAHIVAAGLAIGAELVLLVLALNGLDGTEPRQIYPAMELVGRWVLAPAAVAILVTGLVLARTSGFGLTRYWWVLAKLAITTTLITLAALVLLPALTRAADAATAAGAVEEGQRLALVIPAAVGLSLLVLSAGLGVFKPRWRVRRGAP